MSALLPARRVGWILFKISLMMWAVAMFLFTPTLLEASLQSFIIFAWCGLTFIGGAVSIGGMLLQGTRRRSLGITVEMCSLPVLAVGPLVYFLSQLSIAWVQWPSTDRIALVAFAFATLSAVIARITELVPRFHREGQ